MWLQGFYMYGEYSRLLVVARGSLSDTTTAPCRAFKVAYWCASIGCSRGTMMLISLPPAAPPFGRCALSESPPVKSETFYASSLRTCVAFEHSQEPETRAGKCKCLQNKVNIKRGCCSNYMTGSCACCMKAQPDWFSTSALRMQSKSDLLRPADSVTLYEDVRIYRSRSNKSGLRYSRSW